MHKLIMVLIGAAILLGACRPAQTPAPTANVTAIFQTAEVVVATAFKQTAEAMPTATPPPTESPTPTPAHTDTPAYTETPSATLTPVITDTSIPFEGTLSSSNKPGKTCLLRIENKSSIKPITVAFEGVSPNGNDTYYYAYSVELVFMFQLPWGSWYYRITLGDKKVFTGSFRINNYDKTTIRIFNDKVQIQGP